MKYPSQYLSAFADWLEAYEPHEKIEALADKVNDLEEPIEEKLDWIYERVTAYKRLQETRQELERVKRDRTLLATEYGNLYKQIRAETGEAPQMSSPEVPRAVRRGVVDGIKSPAVRRMAQILDDLRYRTRG